MLNVDHTAQLVFLHRNELHMVICMICTIEADFEMTVGCCPCGLDAPRTWCSSERIH